MASAALSSASSMTQDLSKTLNPEGKDVTQIIIEEHRLVDSLAERYAVETDPKQKQGIAHNIIKLLSIHSACEEASIYPFMRRHLPNGEKLVQHAIEEHLSIKNDLYRLDQMKLGDAGYDETLMKCIKDTQHHVEEEEGDLLPTLKAKSSADELEQMRTEFLRAKMIAPSRPHPSAPTDAPQNKIVNAATMPIDAMRDAGRFSS